MKYSFSWLNNNLCCMGISQLVYPFNYWWMFELFPIWGYYEQSCNAQMCKNFVHKFLCRHMSSNLLGIYLEMELQSHMISLCLTFWVMAKLFSIVTALFYPSANNVWGLISTYPCWCLISIIHFVVVILVGVKWYFFVALICSSLMVSVDDYFFHVLIVHLYIFFGEMSI